jgi:plasmid stabilization system protein ParE
MSPRPIVIHPAAITEARAAVDWYRTKSLSAARAFLKELDRAINMVADKPEIWPQYTQGTQRYLLHRFPFFVVYRQTAVRIEIVAIAHARRKPGYWKERLN